MKSGEGSKRAVAFVGVRKPSVKIEIIPIEKELNVGEKIHLNKKLIPSTSNDFVTWSLSKEGVVEVDRYGNLYAIAPGKVVITGTTLTGMQDSIVVQVAGEIVQEQEEKDSKDESSLPEKDKMIILEENFEQIGRAHV